MFHIGREDLPEPLLARRKLAGWLAPPRPACWLLIAGPGSGKTCSLELLAGGLGGPAVWLTCGAGTRAGLAGHVGLPGDAAPQAIVEALVPATVGTCVVWDAAERLFDQAEALAILERWIERSAGPTLVSSRFPLPFSLTREVIAGRIRRLGPADLWLSDQEAGDWLGPEAGLPGLAGLLAGWPLGIAALKRLADEPDPDAMILALAREEWLAHLPAQYVAWARALWPLPAISAASATQVLAGAGLATSQAPTGSDLAASLAPGAADFATAVDALAGWGLITGAERVRPWHPLVRRHFRAWERPIDEAVLEWLAEHEPETAIACHQARGDLPTAIRLLRRHGVHLLGERAGPWLARFPAGERRRSLELAALEGAWLNARGEIAEAIARLRDALERLGPCSTPAQVFPALLELLYGYWLRQDFAAFREVEAQAEKLVADADFADRIRFWNLKAIIRFDSGGEEEAERLTRQILESPHFGQPGIAYVQQMAALNLGVREVSRGRPEAAVRQFQRALGLAREYPHRQEVQFGARLYLAAGLLELGRLEQAAGHLREMKAQPGGEEGRHRRAVFRSLEGHCHVILGDFPRAAALFEEALDTLTSCGLGESQEAATVQNELAVLHRRRGELSLASSRHAQAGALSGPWPHLAVGHMLQHAVTRIVAGECDRARALLDQAGAMRPAPHHHAAIELIGAILAWREGDPPGDALERALLALEDGGYFHLAIAYPELSPDLWALLGQTGHGDLVAQLEASFPEVAPRALPPGAEPAPSGVPELEIRCFGTLEVSVRGQPIEAWPRKRAKALLALLLVAPGGLARDELLERLFPGKDDADLEPRLNLLTSSLRKLLEPDLAPRRKSRYLVIEGKRLRLQAEGMRVDYLDFEKACKQGIRAAEAGRAAEGAEHFRLAVALYTGDLFHEPILMESFDLERHRCRLQVGRMLRFLADRAFEEGSYEESRALSERLLEIEPTHEEAHRHLMRIYQLFGQEDLLRRQYRLCERILRQELDLEPSEETRKLLGGRAR